MTPITPANNAAKIYAGNILEIGEVKHPEMRRCMEDQWIEAVTLEGTYPNPNNKEKSLYVYSMDGDMDLCYGNGLVWYGSGDEEACLEEYGLTREQLETDNERI